jgi:hypothetical protein
MQVDQPVCCGIDVHKDTRTACLRCVDANGQVSKAGRALATTSTSLLAFADWLVEQHGPVAARESPGVYTPPGILPMVGGIVCRRWHRRRTDAKDDANMLLIYVDPFDQAPKDLPARLKIRLLQSIVHFGGKGFQASQNETQLFLDLSLRFEVFDLGFQVLQPCAPPGHAWFKFLLVKQPLGITIDQPRYPTAQLAHLGFEALVGLGLLLGV